MNQQSFFAFLFQNKQIKTICSIALIGAILQFLLFKQFYPFADFFSDSDKYIYAASTHLDINMWPIGYSKFLSAFHLLTHSDTAVVAFQYFFLQLSCLYLFSTILYFYNPGPSIRNIIFIFLFFNPLNLYLSNYITSDPLFGSLSLCWVTELLWIINRPKVFRIFSNAILLFICFTFRNNAYYYPIISVTAFVLSRQNLKWKLAGMAMPFLFIVPFIIHTRDASEKLTGIRQFSLFTGWQLANNALYMYGHLQLDSTEFPSASSRELNLISQKTFSHAPPDLDAILYEYDANFFIKALKSPLRQYYIRHYHPKDDYEEIVSWGKCSVVFEEFGSWLIKHHPFPYLRYFVLLNTKNYLFPPLEKLNVYNLGEDRVNPIIQDWFEYKTPDIMSASKTIQENILFGFTYLFCFLNILFIGSIVWYLSRRKYQTSSMNFNASIILVGTFLLVNFLFSVFATIIVLRYQFFPMIVALLFPLLVIDEIERKKRIIKAV